MWLQNDSMHSEWRTKDSSYNHHSPLNQVYNNPWGSDKDYNNVIGLGSPSLNRILWNKIQKIEERQEPTEIQTPDITLTEVSSMLK